MIDPQSWVRVRQQDREREIYAAHRSNLLRASGRSAPVGGAPQGSPTGRAPRRSPARPLGPLGRTVGRTLVRVGLWLMVAD